MPSGGPARDRMRRTAVLRDGGCMARLRRVTPISAGVRAGGHWNPTRYMPVTTVNGGHVPGLAGAGLTAADFDGPGPLCASASSFDISTRNVPAATSTIPAASFQPGISKSNTHGLPGFGCHNKLNSVLIAGAKLK